MGCGVTGSSFLSFVGGTSRTSGGSTFSRGLGLCRRKGCEKSERGNDVLFYSFRRVGSCTRLATVMLQLSPFYWTGLYCNMCTCMICDL